MEQGTIDGDWLIPVDEPEEEAPVFREILVALDTSSDSAAALKAAADIAMRMGANLRGLYVEDVDLLRLAASPVAREIAYPFERVLQLRPARMERQMRAEATRVRQAWERACRQRGIGGSFQVVRGDVAAEVLAAASEADLLSIGKVGRPVFQPVSLGSTALAVVDQAAQSVLFLQQAMYIAPPSVTVYDGSDLSRRSLHIASSIAERLGGFLTVILYPREREYSALRHDVSDRLRERELLIRYRELSSLGPSTLIGAVYTEQTGFFVMPDLSLSSEVIRRVLKTLSCPLLLAR